jgi:DNA polymerase-3 subunit gamma/tau
VEEVRYSPTEGRYKVYIIDEVHMLSAGAFNALLKTIEEPPSYVIFILATTEVHKIPVTILSRCQRYDFKRITIDTITDRLSELMKEENIEVEEKALRYVARAADGSLRDALSLLDQCISFYLGKSITYDNVLEVLGAVDTSVFANMLHGIRKQSVTDCIQLLEEIESSGRELGQFTVDFIWYLRNLLLMKTTEEVSEIITEISTENMKLLRQEAGTVDEQSLIRYIRVFSELSNQIRYAARKRVLIEIAIIKLCKPEMEQNYEAMLERIKLLEEKMENGVIMNAGGQQTQTGEAKPKQAARQVILPEALPEDLKEAAKSWKGIVSQVTRKAPALGSVLSGSTLSVDGGNGLMIVVTNSLDKDLIDREGHLQLIKDVIAQMIHKQVQVNTRYLDKEKERLEEVPDLTKLIKVPIQYE